MAFILKNDSGAQVRLPLNSALSDMGRCHSAAERGSGAKSLGELPPAGVQKRTRSLSQRAAPSCPEKCLLAPGVNLIPAQTHAYAHTSTLCIKTVLRPVCNYPVLSGEKHSGCWSPVCTVYSVQCSPDLGTCGTVASWDQRSGQEGAGNSSDLLMASHEPLC